MFFVRIFSIEYSILYKENYMVERKLITGDNVEKAESLIKELLVLMGEDVDRDGLKDTPRRVIKSFEKLYGGYEQKPEDVLGVVFDSDADEMVFCNNIDFWSTCEHHMLPFHGKCHIAYIPNGKVVGVSKLVRLVEVYARRLQIQENLTTQIAEAIMKHTDALGVAVVIEAEHLCMKARGVQNATSYMKTSKLMGEIRDCPQARAEFFELIKHS